MTSFVDSLFVDEEEVCGYEGGGVADTDGGLA